MSTGEGSWECGASPALDFHFLHNPLTPASLAEPRKYRLEHKQGAKVRQRTAMPLRPRVLRKPRIWSLVTKLNPDGEWRPSSCFSAGRQHELDYSESSRRHVLGTQQDPGTGGIQGGHTPIGAPMPSTCGSRSATRLWRSSVPVTLGTMRATTNLSLDIMASPWKMVSNQSSALNEGHQCRAGWYPVALWASLTGTWRGGSDII